MHPSINTYPLTINLLGSLLLVRNHIPVPELSKVEGTDIGQCKKRVIYFIASQTNIINVVQVIPFNQ